MRHTNLNVMNESAIIAGMYESYLDEGLGDLLKKAVDKVKQISAGVKTFMLAQADKISNWVDKNIFEPLKATVSKLVPGYSWGSNKENDSGLIQSVIQILAKQNNQVLESRTAKFSERKADRISEGIQDYVSTVGNSFINEDKRAIVESGAIGAVLSVIHWSHFAVDVLEAILKVAPSIPFLAGLVNKLNKAQEFIKNNPKLAKAMDWYEHGKIGSLPAKDVIGAICIAVGIVEICMGGGIFVIVSTAAGAAWAIMEKIWHHYKKADKEAAKITESFVRGRGKRTRVESRRYFREEDEEDVMEDEDEYEEIEGLHDVDTDEYDDEEDFMDPMYDGDLEDDDNFDDEYPADDTDLDEDEDSDIDYDLSDTDDDEDDSEDPDMDDEDCDPDTEDCDTDDDYCDPEDEDCDMDDEDEDLVPAGDEEDELIERINRLERRIGR